MYLNKLLISLCLSYLSCEYGSDVLTWWVCDEHLHGLIHMENQSISDKLCKMLSIINFI